MPFSIPTKDSYPWADTLNRHLAQLISPTTGGINVWDIRPTVGVNSQSLGPDHIGFTGYNSNSKVFERWNGSSWDILTGSGTMSAALPVWTSGTRPPSPSTGDYGYNSGTKQIERWSGTSWQPVASSDLDYWNSMARPNLSGEPAGKMGFNSTTRQIERWNGSGWENVTSPVIPPLSIWSTVTRPGLTGTDEGRFGYNLTTKQIERWNGSSWDNVTPPVDSNAMMGGMPSWSSRPSVTPQDVNKFGYNTSTKKVERYDGNQWVDVSPRSDTPFGMGSWNTSNRPSLQAGDAGVFGYNTDTTRIERWNGSQWVPVTTITNGSIIPFWSTSNRPSLGPNDVGHTGFNTTTNKLETWNGSSWVPVAPDASMTSTGGQANSVPTWTTGTRPSNPVTGTLGFNSSLPGLEIWNGSSWVPAGSSTGGSATLPTWTNSTRPSNPATGTMGYNTETGNPEMWNGSSWVPMNRPPSDYRPTYQTWTDSTRPTGVPAGTVGYNGTTNTLEMWNGSAWVPISGGIPRHASRPSNPPEGYIYYNTGSDVVEYWDGDEWITLSKSGTTSGNQGDSWENPYQVDSNTDAQSNKYYLLDPNNGPFVFKLPSNPSIGTEVCFRGLTSALTNSVYIDPNGKKFQGSTSRRVYSGTTPICVTYISEAEGWSPSAAIPIEVVVVQPPADTSLFMLLKSDLGVFKNSGNRVHLWSGDINSNPFQLTVPAPNGVSITPSDIDYYGPAFEDNTINGKPSIRFDNGYKYLFDKTTPSSPRKYSLFIVAKADWKDDLAYFMEESSMYQADYTFGGQNTEKGFVFTNYGIHQTRINLANNPPGVSVLYPSSKRAPGGTYAIYVYQVNYDDNFLALLNNTGEYLAMGSSIPMNNDGTRSVFVGGNSIRFSDYPFPSSAVNINKCNFNMVEVRWYNNILNSSQVKAVCDSLRTTYQITYMF